MLIVSSLLVNNQYI